MLNSKNVKTHRPSKKLDSKRLGPFKIISKINDVAFKLDLPSTMKIHPVFHVSLLEKVPLSSILNRSIPIPSTIIIDDELEYEVDYIIDSDPSHNTWEPSDHLLNCPDLLSTFHSSFPSKPNAIHSVQSLKSGGTVRTPIPRAPLCDPPRVLRTKPLVVRSHRPSFRYK